MSVHESLTRATLPELHYNWLLTIEIDSGDVLLGGLFHSIDRFEDFPLAFNDRRGTVYGPSAIAQIPYIRIVSITKVTITDPIYANTLPMRYPNPLATIIFQHNFDIATQQGIVVLHYMENALSNSAIPEDGIRFAEWLLIYTDHHNITFDNALPVEVGFNLGIIYASTIINNAQRFPLQAKLRQIKPVHNAVQFLSLEGTHLAGFNGILQHRLNQDDNVEGEQCYLWEVAIVNGEQVEIRLCLIKTARLKYPLGLIDKVTSELTFIAEPLPMPMHDSSGNVHNIVYLVRAVAYVPVELGLR